MSKELTPLEALDKLVAYILLDDEYGLMDKQEVKNVKHDKKIIETALKKQIIDDNEHPRKKDFKRDNRLRLAYQEMGRYSKNNEVPQELRGKPYGDIIGIVPKEEKARWDIYLLFNMLIHRPIQDRQWDKDKKCFIEYPCLLQELENRGYDVKTIYFEIAKKDKRKKYIPYKNYLRFNENYNFDYKTEQKKLNALEIIKKEVIEFGYTHLDRLLEEKTYQDYINWCVNEEIKEHYTKEQFDLLKEVLK